MTRKVVAMSIYKNLKFQNTLKTTKIVHTYVLDVCTKFQLICKIKSCLYCIVRMLCVHFKLVYRVKFDENSGCQEHKLKM